MDSLNYSESLRSKASKIWEKIMAHPFIMEISEGKLPLEKFRFYIKQDYAYLIEFIRCLGIAIAKVGDRNAMRTLVSCLHTNMTIEVEMLERFSEKIGLPLDELRKTDMAPTNMGYTRHLLTVAYSGTVGETISAMLPCIWSYMEIALKIGDSPALKEHPIFNEWCSTYKSKEYRDLVEWYRDFIDDVAGGSSPVEREKMLQHFILSSRFEYMFWDMAYRMESWPV
jgi:thiaminase/transcriptional activator TenA